MVEIEVSYEVPFHVSHASVSEPRAFVLLVLSQNGFKVPHSNETRFLTRGAVLPHDLCLQWERLVSFHQNFATQNQ